MKDSRYSPLTRLLSVYLAWCFACPLTAATLEGRVTAENGEALPLATVTVYRGDGLYLESTYTGKDGSFRLQTSLSGKLALKIRSPGYADTRLGLEIPADGRIERDFGLSRLGTDEEISQSLTGSSQFSRVRLADSKNQLFFQNDCLSCHQLGNAFTRRPRPRAAWAAIVDRMLGFMNIQPGEARELAARYTDLLATSFDGTVVVKQERHVYDPAHEAVTIREWKYPSAQIAHDAMVHSQDDLFYTVDQGNDNVYITDPHTNITEIFTLPANGMPVGGRLGGLVGNTASASFSARHAPHSLQEGPDHRFYLTSSFANQIGILDPKTRDYEAYDVGHGAAYPHTLRFDDRGRVWFTNINSDQVGRFDPRTKEMRVIDLPKTTNRPGFAGLLPYGIDVHPIDGSIWYSRLGAHKIGRIDPETLAFEEFDPPFYGPRRLRFAADGTLWIPAFAEGRIARLDTLTMEYKLYTIPRLTPDGIETPYALAVHPQTGDVWITANQSDRMFQFIPEEERFIAYPLPTRGHYLRDIFFSKEGWVCGPSSPLPAGPTIEDNMQGLVCIIKE